MPTVDENKLLGINGKCYVGAAGGTPTGLLEDEVSVEISIQNTIVKWHSRGKPRKDSGYGPQEITAKFSVNKDNTNTQFTALAAAATGRTLVAVKFLDKTSGNGYDGDWTVASMNEKQESEGVITVDFELALSQLYRDITVI